ncbi:MAG: methyl-accepting chemotaxis protein, partial [Gammaproteobacteria bacterium]|nr:methyl-accepting chemotaxis protein [Gammaproteobacteria bacterium]
DEVTQQNAALAEETSAASASMSDKAREMADMVAFFKVTGHTQSRPADSKSHTGGTSVRAQAAVAPAPRKAATTAPSRTAVASAASAKPVAPKKVAAVAAPPRKAPPPSPAFDEDEWEEF